MSNPGLYLPAECVCRCISLTGAAFIGALPGTVTAHAAGQKQFSGDVCFIFPFVYACFCRHIALSPAVAVLRDSGSRREMSAHVHTGTLRHFNTTITVQNLTHCETNAHHVNTASNTESEEGGDTVSVRLPGHVQPSTHSSLQTSWMLRLWQVVEQDLVHSLYCIPIGHLGTEHKTHLDY